MRKVDIVRLMFLLILCVSSVRCIYAESFDGTADTDYAEIVYGGETEDPPVVQGCLDVNADNYNAEATIQGLDDYGNIACDYSSCDDIPDAEGCFYPNNYSAFNADFTPALCDEYGGTACTAGVQGCLDVNADNYNAEATIQATDQFGNIACDYSSCDDIPDAEGCIYPAKYSVFHENFTTANCFEYGGMACQESSADVEGCLNPNADNYNAEATIQGLDDYGNIACDYSSCDDIPDAEGCFYPNNYSAFNADFTPALCDEYGGTACVSDINTTGVQPTAQDVYNSALQSNTNNALLSAGGDDSGSDISISYSIGQVFNDTHSSVQQTELGCTHIDACNYNINATDHDGSCQFAEVYYNCNGTCLNDTDGDGVCDELEIVGCQDDVACNYNLQATDSGTCTYANGCDECSGAIDGSGTVVDNDTDDDGICNDDEILGCMDQSALNFDLNATDADGSCMIPSLITCGSSVTGSTTGTLNNYGGPSAEAIYRFEADVTGDYEFSSCGSDYDTYLRIYDANMNELYSADDDGDCNYQAIINRELSPGSYYVLIEGYQELAGFYTLTVTCPTTSTEGSRDLTLSDSSPNYASNSPMLYNVQVFMEDSYGDGWNGNTYEISQSGSSFARGGRGFTTGYEAEESWMLAEGCYKMRVGGGGWPQEVSWHIVVSNPSSGTSTTQGTTGEVDLAVGSFDCGSHSWHNWARLDSPPQIEEVIESSVELELSTSLEMSTNLLILNSKGLSEGERLYCQLYDVLGNLLASKEVVDARTDIAMDYLPAAVYMLKVSAYNNETLKTFKMVKH